VFFFLASFFFVSWDIFFCGFWYTGWGWIIMRGVGFCCFLVAFFSFGYVVWRWIDQHVSYTKYVIEDLNHAFGVQVRHRDQAPVTTVGMCQRVTSYAPECTCNWKLYLGMYQSGLGKDRPQGSG
jgi:hypothetical protein